MPLRALVLALLLDGAVLVAQPLGSVDATVRRVLADLVTNATAHTPPGTRVDVLLSGDEATVVVEVRDDGPGTVEVDSAVGRGTQVRVRLPRAA